MLNDAQLSRQTDVSIPVLYKAECGPGTMTRCLAENAETNCPALGRQFVKSVIIFTNKEKKSQ